MKEITGIFENKENLDQAFEELGKIGIKKEDIDLAAREKNIRSKLGEDYSSIHDLNAKSDVPRMKYVSEKLFYTRENIFMVTVMYFGVFAAILIAILKHQSVGFDIVVAFSAGMFFQFFGIFISGIFRKRHGDYIERKLNKGGFLFWIKVKGDRNLQNKACKTLRKFSAKKVRIINEN